MRREVVFAVKPILKPSDLRTTTSAHVNMMLMASFGLVEWLVYGLSGVFRGRLRSGPG